VLVSGLIIQLGIDLVYIAAKTKGIIFSVVIIQFGTLTFQFLKSRKQNNFVQYSFRLSVLAPKNSNSKFFKNNLKTDSGDYFFLSIFETSLNSLV